MVASRPPAIFGRPNRGSLPILRLASVPLSSLKDFSSVASEYATIFPDFNQFISVQITANLCINRPCSRPFRQPFPSRVFRRRPLAQLPCLRVFSTQLVPDRPRLPHSAPASSCLALLEDFSRMKASNVQASRQRLFHFLQRLQCQSQSKPRESPRRRRHASLQMAVCPQVQHQMMG